MTLSSEIEKAYKIAQAFFLIKNAKINKILQKSKNVQKMRSKPKKDSWKKIYTNKVHSVYLF